MVEIAWPSSPLLKVIGLHGRDVPFPQYEIQWTEEDEFVYPIEADSIAFDVELVSDSTARTTLFRLGVETVDEDDNKIQDVVGQEIYVSNDSPQTLTLAVPLNPVTTRFKVTIGVLMSRSLSGSENWYAPESRIFQSGFIPIEAFGKVMKKYCFIATAAHGSELAPPVQFLREFRDDVVHKSRYSRAFEKLLNVYYWFSPPIARAMIRNKPFKYAMKYTVVWPFVVLVGAITLIIRLIRR